MPFVYEHPVYWQKVQEETKGSGDFERSTCLFIDSEKAREHSEEEMIKIENIKGKLFLVGAEDDSFWETAKYIHRMFLYIPDPPAISFIPEYILGIFIRSSQFICYHS